MWMRSSSLDATLKERGFQLRVDGVAGDGGHPGPASYRASTALFMEISRYSLYALWNPVRDCGAGQEG